MHRPAIVELNTLINKGVNNSMISFFLTLSRLLVSVSSIGLFFMLVLVVLNVLSRAIFNFSIPAVDTIVASYLMIMTIFLPLAMIEILKENISVDALYARASDFARHLFDFVGHLLSGIFYLILAWLYLRTAIESYEIREFVTGTWNVPIWPARIIMPIGLGLAGAAAALKLFLIVRALFSRSNPGFPTTAGSV